MHEINGSWKTDIIKLLTTMIMSQFKFICRFQTKNIGI